MEKYSKQHSTCFVMGVRLLDAEYALVVWLWHGVREKNWLWKKRKEERVITRRTWNFHFAPTEQYGAT